MNLFFNRMIHTWNYLVVGSPTQFENDANRQHGSTSFLQFSGWTFQKYWKPLNHKMSIVDISFTTCLFIFTHVLWRRTPWGCSHTYLKTGGAKWKCGTKTQQTCMGFTDSNIVKLCMAHAGPHGHHIPCMAYLPHAYGYILHGKCRYNIEISDGISQKMEPSLPLKQKS